MKNFKAGDEVYGMHADKPHFLEDLPGFASEYVVTYDRFLLHKPPQVSWEDAASCLGFTVTSIQTIRRGLQLRGQQSLQGQTVYVPAALSGTGAVAIQVAKNFYGAKKIITTVSTSKVPLVEQHLPGMVDQVVDYRTEDLKTAIGINSVDFMLNTQWTSLMPAIPLMKRNTGTLMSITSIPSKGVARELFGADKFPWWMAVLLDLAQLYYAWRLRGTGVKYEMVSGGLQNREDVEQAGELIAVGKVKPVIRVVDLKDVEKVRAEIGKVASGKGDEGKGGLGKLVVRVA